MLANIRGSGFDGALHFASERSFDAHPHAIACEAVEPARVFEQRPIAAPAHVVDNRRDDALGFFQARRLARDQPCRVPKSKNPYHHITILLRGYSTMPCAPASLSRGIIVRTVISS